MVVETEYSTGDPWVGEVFVGTQRDGAVGEGLVDMGRTHVF